MAGKISVHNKSIIALFLVTLLFATPIFSQGVATNYRRGRRAGIRQGAANASIMWVIPGFCCGCFGVGAAYLWSQTVPAGRLVGRSPGYVRGYTFGYKKAKRERETIYAVAGCIIGNIAGYSYYYLY